MVTTTDERQGWRERKKGELRERIYATSLELFRSRGYDGTTVDEITLAVGVAKGTFFNHFPTKQAILLEWYGRLTLRSLREAEARAHGSGMEAVLSLFGALARGAMADRDLFRAKTAGGDADLVEAERRLDARVRDYLEGRLRLALDRSELEQGTDVEALTDLLLALLTGTGRVWATRGCSFPLDERLGEQTRLIFRALGTGEAPD